MTTLDIPGATGTQLNAISDNGTIAGQYTVVSGSIYDFVRSPDGSTITTVVDTAVPYFITISGVNDSGTIAGYYYYNPGGGYVEDGIVGTLSAVPEPSSVALLCLGSAVAVVARRRRPASR